MRALCDHRIGIVLADQVMAVGRETELGQSIKNRWPDLPVILISGANEVPPDAIFADLYIGKVEGPAELDAKISEIHSARRSSLD